MTKTSDTLITDAAVDYAKAHSRIVSSEFVQHASRLERDRAELIGALQDCVDAAAKDIVEDFSAVSNAADAALALLVRLKEPS